jgi:hypothetical protein
MGDGELGDQARKDQIVAARTGTLHFMPTAIGVYTGSNQVDYLRGVNQMSGILTRNGFMRGYVWTISTLRFSRSSMR